MSTVTRPRASFGVEKRDIPGVEGRAQAMHDGIVVNTSTFNSPPISMATFATLITALVLAQQNVTNTKAKGSATLRDAKRDALWTAMEVLRAYVQSLADGQSAQNAAALIEMAGLLVAETAVHTKPLLAATLTPTPGVVHLEVNASALLGKADASKKVTFHWQWSADGKTWNDVRSTPYASTDVEGLALLTTHSFRVSATIGKVAGPWSQAVSLLVH
jgi:hypothetical protein